MKINPRTLKILGLYGAYQDGIAKDTIGTFLLGSGEIRVQRLTWDCFQRADGKDVTGHIFEYTTQVVVDSKGVVSAGVSPVQILFCLKEQSE